MKGEFYWRGGRRVKFVDCVFEISMSASACAVVTGADSPSCVFDEGASWRKEWDKEKSSITTSYESILVT
jgi:hypothetical protein